MNQHAAAITSFDALIRDHGSHKLLSQAYYARAMSKQQSGQFEAALPDIKHLGTDAKYANSSDVAYLKGLCEVGLNQLENAATTFSGIVKNDSEYASLDKVFYELGWVYKNLDRNEDATVVFERLAVEHPTSTLASESVEFCRKRR